MASKTPLKFLDEDAAVKAVLSGLRDGFERLHATADRMIARGGMTGADSAFLRKMERALLDFSEGFADDAVFGDGKYAELLREAYAKGAATLATKTGITTDAALADDVLAAVDPETIRVALWPARLEIKGLTDEAAQAITELTAKSMTAGWSPRELSERIQADVTLGGDSTYAVPEWRAESMARNEPMKVYRESTATSQGWDDDTLLQMFGPDDARTAGDICSEYNGLVMTLREWRKVGADPLGYGFHPN